MSSPYAPVRDSNLEQSRTDVALLEIPVHKSRGGDRLAHRDDAILIEQLMIANRLVGQLVILILSSVVVSTYTSSGCILCSKQGTYMKCRLVCVFQFLTRHYHLIRCTGLLPPVEIYTVYVLSDPHPIPRYQLALGFGVFDSLHFRLAYLRLRRRFLGGAW